MTFYIWLLASCVAFINESNEPRIIARLVGSCVLGVFYTASIYFLLFLITCIIVGVQALIGVN